MQALLDASCSTNNATGCGHLNQITTVDNCLLEYDNGIANQANCVVLS